MSNHSLAFVPLGAGYHQSTDVFARGRSVDTGLLAEALIYYDRVCINVDNPHRFAELISWLVQQGLTVQNLIALIRDGVISVYDFAFFTSPYVDFIGDDGLVIHGLFNGQGPEMLKPNSFRERYLEFESLRECFESSAQLREFAGALEGCVIEVKADDIGGGAIENAYQDFLNPERNSLITQHLVNEIYRIKSLGKPPRIRAKVQSLGAGQFNVTWNMKLNRLPALEVESNIRAADTLPLSTAAEANKYLWAADRMKCDLYLAPPISALVGDKLFEAAETAAKSRAKTRNVIEELEIQVEFPDLRRFVNDDKIDFCRVVEIRKKAKRFRNWLQSEGDRDRNAITAYHHEVAKESGFSNVKRRALRAFGVLSGAAIGATLTAEPTIGVAIGGVGGAVVQAAAEEGVKYLFDLSASVGADWKPVVFGNWYSGKIAKLLKDDS